MRTLCEVVATLWDYTPADMMNPRSADSLPFN